MPKTVINIKVDKEVKEKARTLAEALGLPLSTIVNANLKEFIRSGEVTFSIEPKLRSEVWEELKKASADYQGKKNISRAFVNVNEALDYLNK